MAGDGGSTGGDGGAAGAEAGTTAVAPVAPVAPAGDGLEAGGPEPDDDGWGGAEPLVPDAVHVEQAEPYDFTDPVEDASEDDWTAVEDGWAERHVDELSVDELERLTSEGYGFHEVDGQIVGYDRETLASFDLEPSDLIGHGSLEAAADAKRADAIERAQAAAAVDALHRSDFDRNQAMRASDGLDDLRTTADAGAAELARKSGTPPEPPASTFDAPADPAALRAKAEELMREAERAEFDAWGGYESLTDAQKAEAARFPGDPDEPAEVGMDELLTADDREALERVAKLADDPRSREEAVAAYDRRWGEGAAERDTALAEAILSGNELANRRQRLEQRRWAEYHKQYDAAVRRRKGKVSSR